MALTDPKAGGWAFGEVLTSDQVNTLRSELLKCADFSGGDSVTPSAPVIVNGDGGGVGHGLSVENLAVTGTANVPSGASVAVANGGAMTLASGASFTARADDFIITGGREVPLFQHYNANDRFSRISSGGWIQSDITDAGELLFPVPLPWAGTIVAAHVVVDGRDGTFGSPHAGLPGTVPSVSLKKVVATQGNNNVTTSVVATSNDASASLTAYEQVHKIAITGISETIETYTSYWLAVKGEAGANAIANCFAIYKAYVVLTV